MGGSRRSDLGCERSRLHLVKQLRHRRIYHSWKFPLLFCRREATWKILCVHSVFIFCMFWLKNARYFNFLLLLHGAQSSTIKSMQFALVRLLSCFSCACVCTVTVWTSITLLFSRLMVTTRLMVKQWRFILAHWRNTYLHYLISLKMLFCLQVSIELHPMLTEISVIFLSARQCVMFSFSVTELVFSCAEKT